MKMITVFLSDADEKRLKRIKELRYPLTDITEEKLIRNVISTYWLAFEQRADKEKAKSPQEQRADQRLREENMGITDDWREHDA